MGAAMTGFIDDNDKHKLYGPNRCHPLGGGPLNQWTGEIMNEYYKFQRQTENIVKSCSGYTYLVIVDQSVRNVNNDYFSK